MNAALTEVTIERTAIAIASRQPSEITQVRANPGGPNGRVLPTLPGLLEEGGEAGDAVRRFELEIRPGMNAALTEVTIDRTAIAIASPQPIEITQVRANPGGRNGRILPTFPGGRFARHEGCCAEA